MAPLDRRSFLRTAALGGAALAASRAAPGLARSSGAGLTRPTPFTSDSVLTSAAADAPVDHVVVLMMENRSVDHHLGWLGHDEGYIERGRSRYGAGFAIDAENRQVYRAPDGRDVATYHLPSDPDEQNPYRRCGGHPDPGHGWDHGRAQRDGGFLAEGSRNDEFALGYYQPEDVPVYAELARRFTTFDRYHCSVLSSTYPNREYLHSAQSGGHKSNTLPDAAGGELGFQWETIWDRLMAALVPAGYYFVDLPVAALWGPRVAPVVGHIEQYFARCASGTLPNVTFIDPGFTTGLRTDDHPGGADIRAGQRYVLNAFKAFAESPHWENGVFIVTYDEWGGLFDHVRPPILPDDRASADDKENFGQAGFRVPTLMASPYARRGFVDPTLYDHTSILRFIEWRFLGAPATGSGGEGWWLTTRDRHANNIGASLHAGPPDAGVALPLLPEVPVTSVPCDDTLLSGIPEPGEAPDGGGGGPGGDGVHPFEKALDEGFFERMGYKIDLRPLPY